MAGALLHNHTDAKDRADLRSFTHRRGGTKGQRRRENDGWAAVAHLGATTSGFRMLPICFCEFLELQLWGKFGRYSSTSCGGRVTMVDISVSCGGWINVIRDISSRDRVQAVSLVRGDTDQM
ncbi:hypothetical protein HN873_028517 [Arachis hypogaea]